MLNCIRAILNLHDAVREGGELLGAVGGDEEVVLEPQAAAPFPVDARLDREHHALLDLAAAGLVRVGRLVRTGADAVADRMRRLAGVARGLDPRADAPVELGEARARLY